MTVVSVASTRWPWWVWVVAGALVVIALVVTPLAFLRLHGQAKLQGVLADLRTKNLIYLPADFVALAPMVDEDRQERVWAQQQRILNEKWAQLKFTTSMDRLSLKPTARVDQSLADDSLTERTAWRALYQEGPVILGGFGWIRRDFPHPETIGINQAVLLRVANLLASRALAFSIAAAVLLSKDPRTDLADLDALVRAMESPGSVIDAMVLCAVANVRDQAWLEATLRGTDPASWIANRPPLGAAVSTAFMGERAWLVGGLYQDYKQDRNLGSEMAPGGMAWAGTAFMRCVSPYDLAFAFHCEGEIERRLRGESVKLSTVTAELHKRSILHPMSDIVLSNLIEAGGTGIQFDVTARRLRCAGAVIHAWNLTKQLPSSTHELLTLLPTDLLSAHMDGPEIHYSVVAPGRFRLWTDPATPATDLLPAGRIDAPKPTTAAWSEGKWWLELDLSQVPPQ